MKKQIVRTGLKMKIQIRKLIFILFAFTLVFAWGCAPKIYDREDATREEAFPDMSFENSSPRRKASLEITEDGVRESTRGLYLRAMKKYEKAIDIDPTNPYAYFHYGVARQGMKEYDQSMRLLDEAQDKFGTNEYWLSRVHTYKGLNYMNMGKNEEAKESFKKALDLDKNNLKARANLYQLLHSDNG